MRRKLVLKNKRRFLTFIFSVMLLVAIIIIFNCCDNVFGYVSPEYDTIYVTEGDTLWGIAMGRLKNGVDIREYIYNVKQLNNLESSTLYIGQELVLPR